MSRWAVVEELELRKLRRAPVARIAFCSVLVLVTVTTAGGYAAAVRAGGTDLGRKAAQLVVDPGWAGYTGLAATSVGISVLLAAGIVMAWSVGRELTDGTVVGLFALPVGTGTLAAAKVVTASAWVAILATCAATLVVLAGVVLGLPPAGALSCWATVWLVATLLGISALPVMWVATIGRGYLAGIAATLALVVLSNVLAGFGLGGFVPWATPVLWATAGTGLPPVLLLLPIFAAVLGGGMTVRAWRHLELGAT